VSFDVRTLQLLLMLHLVCIAGLLPVLMGRHVSQAARWGQAAMAAQALGWLAMIASARWFEAFLSPLAISAMAASLYFLQRALAGWLGPRPAVPLMLVALVLGPLGYAIGFQSYAFRVAWANGWLALQMLILCASVFGSDRVAAQGWRALVCGCMAAMAVVTAWRGVLGGLFTELYPSFAAPHPVNLAAFLIAHLSVILVTVALLVAWHEEAEEQLRSLAVTDGLTGVLNRRAWQERAAAFVDAAQRHHHGLVLMMLDLDHFKAVNDQHGHDVGDRALQLTARLLLANVRSSDLVGRYGGEEFCLLLSHTDAEAARGFDRRLRRALAEAARAELGLALDYSAGMTILREGDLAVEVLLKRADRALYIAKQEGRARLEYMEV
jgi:diguanylate cyclase (GGDEF)-like protein